MLNGENELKIFSSAVEKMMEGDYSYNTLTESINSITRDLSIMFKKSVSDIQKANEIYNSSAIRL